MKLHVIILLCSVLIASFSQILLKKSAGKTYRSVIFEYLNPYVICGYGMMFLSMFLTILAMRHGIHQRADRGGHGLCDGARAELLFLPRENYKEKASGYAVHFCGNRSVSSGAIKGDCRQENRPQGPVFLFVRLAAHVSICSFQILAVTPACKEVSPVFWLAMDASSVVMGRLSSLLA